MLGHVDAVIVCTPSGSHLEAAVRAARAGKHVLVEKPLEVTAERCDQIIEACEQNRVWLATVFQSRFHESAQAMKQAVTDGRFGTIALATATVQWFRDQAYYDSSPWRGTWSLDGGGALMNQAIHNVDLLQWLMGAVRSVTAHVATLAHQRIEVEDCAAAALEFTSGALGVIAATTVSWPGWQKRLEICGSTGSARLEDDRLTQWQFANPRDEDAQWTRDIGGSAADSGGATRADSISHWGHRRQIEDFIDSISSGRAPAVDGREARKSVAIIEAIYRSARSGGTPQTVCDRNV
jgi:predicted dehydrogenase